MTTLYLVPLPMGDPDDITMRALRILGEASAVATNDAEAGRALLDRYKIDTAIIGYGDMFEGLARGDVALIRTNGTPGIGDAAQDVVREAIARGVQVVPLPGADAAITALVLAGLPTDSFVAVGELPDDLSQWANERATLIFSSNEAQAALERLLKAFGDRRVSIARLKQPNEAAYRGTLSAAPDELDEAMNGVVIVVEGAAERVADVWDEGQVRAELRRRMAAGERLNAAAKAVAKAARWDRRAVYALGVEEKGKTP